MVGDLPYVALCVYCMRVLVEYGSEGYLWGIILVPSNGAPGCVYMSECMNS